MAQNVLSKIKKASPDWMKRVCTWHYRIYVLGLNSLQQSLIFTSKYIFLIFQVSINLFTLRFNAISKHRVCDAYFKPDIDSITWQ